MKSHARVVVVGGGVMAGASDSTARPPLPVCAHAWKIAITAPFKSAAYTSQGPIIHPMLVGQHTTSPGGEDGARLQPTAGAGVGGMQLSSRSKRPTHNLRVEFNSPGRTS